MKTRILEQVLPHGNTIGQGDPLPEKIHGQRRQGHDPKTADLNEKEDNRLPDRRKSGSGVDHGQPGNAGCGCSGKQGIGQGYGIPCSQTYGQREKETADNNGQAKKNNREEQRLKKKTLKIHGITILFRRFFCTLSLLQQEPQKWY